MKDSTPMTEERYKLIAKGLDTTAEGLEPNVLYILQMIALVKRWKREG